jgi:hypothetical protein
MNKLVYAAVGATVTLLSASPAFAQTISGDMASQLETQAKISQVEVAQAPDAGVVTGDEAVLGEQALPILGFEAPMQVKLDMLTALRGVAHKNLDLGGLTGGGSTD